MPTTGIGHEITLWHPYAFVRDSPQILLTSRFMATGVYGSEPLRAMVPRLADRVHLDRPTAMYIRFEGTKIDPDSGREEGIFQVAQRLRRSGALDPHASDQLRSLLHWFNVHLNKPARLHRPNKRAAVCWFKADAKVCIDRVWAMVAIIREHGEEIRSVTCERLDYVVFEDQYQVAAVPTREELLR